MDEVTTHPTAPVDTANPPASTDDEEEMPRVVLTRRSVGIFVVFIVVSLGFLYFALPQIAGVGQTWTRINDGDHSWLAVALAFELLSIVAYIVMFRTVCARGTQIGWRETYEITMAGIAATRLFAAGGAGGVALTAWALRRSGMERRIVACRMVAFLVLTYVVYMAALLIGGIGLRIGLFSGPAPFALTIVPAIFAAVVIVIVLALAFVPEDFERRLQRWSSSHGRLGTIAQRLATAPATMSSGVRTAISLVRTGDPSLLASVAWWGFNVGILWACFHAFGDPPPFAIVVMGFFVGMLGNLLPLPGGVGGVDGGMIGAFIGFDVDQGLAIVAVLAYRGFAFWLPTLPGAVAYLQLRRTVSRWRAEPARA
jgi:uncharacterized protein (TIRG00374 family)